MDPEYTIAVPLTPAHFLFTPDSLLLLKEGIHLVFSRWSSIQMAVTNEWGGRDSRLKYDEFCTSIISWFSNCREEPDIHDLEDLIDDNMVNSFNTYIEDGSIEEVAERLMEIYGELLSTSAISLPMTATNAISLPATSAVPQSTQPHDLQNEEASAMMTDDTNQESAEEEGWSVVASRRNRHGQRSS
ncbi:putative Pre-rRNA-processing protein TSR2 [Zostera marina]|uniref:Putative Pre-rRNA-processing protein TSR2 n=1 Tax=Zostera marina TaxID=29655 RepID=A0A0K9NIY0_ZOSMR|nr:putative Pre-rRNA-processing protein TSR2 [Zostera marina]